MSAAPKSDVVLRLWTPYVLRRLQVGHTLNGELEKVDEKYQPLVARMNAVAPGPARQELFKWACVAWDESEVDALTLAIAQIDPDGPPPADDVPEPWPAMRLDEPPPAEAFPVDVLPAAASELVQAAAASIGCSPDHAALATLAAAAGAIGRSVSLKLKDSYFAPASLYACLVGPPSDGKTPALDAAAEPVKRIGRTLAEEHRQAMRRWEAEEEAAAKLPKGQKPPPTPPPQARRIDVDDITMETIPQILEPNPRGLILIKDELSGLLTGANQYKGGKGNDRQVWLNIWSGTEIVKDRVGNGKAVSIRCPHPLLTIVGGMQPDMLGEMVDAKGRSDGLVERFLFAYPDPTPAAKWSKVGIPSDTADRWAKVIDRLWLRPMNVSPEGWRVPHAAFMDAAAEAEWDRSFNAHVDEMNADDFPESRRAMWGKFRDHAARLALVLALMRHAADPTADALDVPYVDRAVIRDAWRLVAYFKSHYLRARDKMDRGPASEDAAALKTVVTWLRAKSLATFTERDLKQARKINDEAREKAFARLIALNVIRLAKPKPNPAGGRPSKVFEVNPALYPSKPSATA